MIYNPDIHHRRSIRLREYDYSSAGAYSVTCCVQGRDCLFGDIVGREMRLNDAGKMVSTVWEELPNRFPHVALDTFVIMPNHFHGIIVLIDRRGEPCVRPYVRPERLNGIQTHNHQKTGDHKDRPYGTNVDSAGRVMQAFKSLSTLEYVRGVNQRNWPTFPGRLWQRNYHERVIRNDAEMFAIREYILSNPLNWADDENHPG